MINSFVRHGPNLNQERRSTVSSNTPTDKNLLNGRIDVEKRLKEFRSIISFIEEGESLGDIYCKIRNKHQASQEDIGKIVNGCRAVISNIETGKRDLRMSEIESLARHHNDFRLAAIAYLQNIEPVNL